MQLNLKRKYSLFKLQIGNNEQSCGKYGETESLVHWSLRLMSRYWLESTLMASEAIESQTIVINCRNYHKERNILQPEQKLDRKKY